MPTNVEQDRFLPTVILSGFINARYSAILTCDNGGIVKSVTEGAVPEVILAADMNGASAAS